MPPSDALEPGTLQIRLATPADHDAILRLFRTGMLEGQVRDGDTGADVDHLVEGYFSDEGASAFWVAATGDGSEGDGGGCVIGMIGVQRTGSNQAEVRRFRVDERFRRQGVGTRLMGQAINFCHARGYLKVVLDVRIERGPAISMFEKVGFRHARTRAIDERKTLEFYLDLYSETR